MLARGVGMQRESNGECNFDLCPHRKFNAKGQAECSLLVEMLCQKKGLLLPCGFVPPEEQRRKGIMDSTGTNKF